MDEEMNIKTLCYRFFFLFLKLKLQILLWNHREMHYIRRVLLLERRKRKWWFEKGRGYLPSWFGNFLRASGRGFLPIGFEREGGGLMGFLSGGWARRASYLIWAFIRVGGGLNVGRPLPKGGNSLPTVNSTHISGHRLSRSIFSLVQVDISDYVNKWVRFECISFLLFDPPT